MSSDLEQLVSKRLVAKNTFLGKAKSLKKLFLYQIYGWDCGPTALLNTIIWASGKRPTDLRRARKLAKELVNTDSDGTFDEDLFRLLKAIGKRIGYTVTSRKKLNWKMIDRKLRSGQKMILAHLDRSGEWHYSSWFVNDFNELIGVNVFFKKDPSEFHVDDLKAYVRVSDEHGVSPNAFFIKRNKK